jgi:DNA polymerase
MTLLAGPGPNLSLSLDKRQRAMLKEMGIQVWQPVAQVAAAAPAPAAPPVQMAAAPAVAVASVASVSIDSGATRAHNQRAAGTFDTQKQSFQAPQAAPEFQNTAHNSPSPNAWRVGTLQTLYTPHPPTTAARWLVLLESPASALQEAFNPLEGDAGKLLDNMLRAAQLHTAGSAMLVPLVRGGGVSGDLNADLAGVIASFQPDVVLVMGRLAAQAVLQSTEPLGKLRGHIHRVHSAPTLITIDPAYLLRNPLDKAKVWDDLCLAMSLVQAS